MTYALNEMDDMEKIFEYGHTRLDNNTVLSKLLDNTVELINRALSLHRRNSLFFGSHAGAARHAIFYSLGRSCRRLGVNFWQYIIDTLNAAAKLPPTAPQEKLQLPTTLSIDMYPTAGITKFSPPSQVRGFILNILFQTINKVLEV